MKTYSRSDWDAAQEAWRDFSPEWRAVRHQAAMRGILFPPNGTRWDSWEDDSPSQRAMLIRAIRESPSLLERCIARSRSWSEVIGKLTSARDDWRYEQAERARHIVREDPDHRQSMQSISAILQRIAEAS